MPSWHHEENENKEEEEEILKLAKNLKELQAINGYDTGDEYNSDHDKFDDEGDKKPPKDRIKELKDCIYRCTPEDIPDENDKLRLHKQFNNIVKEMIDKNVELPPEFELHYLVKMHSDRLGNAVAITPFLSKTKASKKVKEPKYWCGKYGSKITYKVISTDDCCARTENFSFYDSDIKSKIGFISDNQ